MFFSTKHSPKAGDVGECDDWAAIFTGLSHSPLEDMWEHRWLGPTPTVSNLVGLGGTPSFAFLSSFPSDTGVAGAGATLGDALLSSVFWMIPLCEFPFLSFLFSLGLHLAWLWFLLREGAAHIRWRMIFMCRRLPHPAFPVKILFRVLCTLFFSLFSSWVFTALALWHCVRWHSAASSLQCLWPSESRLSLPSGSLTRLKRVFFPLFGIEFISCD